jgi:hypothetical protein
MAINELMTQNRITQFLDPEESNWFGIRHCRGRERGCDQLPYFAIQVALSQMIVMLLLDEWLIGEIF